MVENFGITHLSVDERTCVVAVEGELDLASAPHLKLALVELLGKGYARYVLDLSQLTHMDSMGLGVLIGFHKRLPRDARLALAGVPPKQRKLLELTGLDTRFDSFATVDDALSARAESALPFCTDAAMVLGLASTALPFATTRRAEALRWLRILRLQGEAARVLCALGVGETPLPDLDQDDGDELLAPAGRADRDPVASVSELAVRVARKRGAAKVGTGDILVAVLRFYGSDFDLVLAAHGTDRDEVIDRLDEAA
ncbi:MAG TPA: STAS domain-containing protein [Solirubrobacteraceae bacterium]|nr:STAS domain-containing protein [Solirubrobacteraceae bacterium]